LISPSNKSYIGVTSKDVLVRFKEHVLAWRNARNCRKLCYAFDKYPPELWMIHILYKSDTKSDAESKEMEFIKFYDTVANGYNVLIGGNLSRFGLSNSVEMNRKIGKGNKGKKVSAEAILRMSKPKSASHKANTSKGLRGRQLSESHKRNISIANKGKSRSKPVSGTTKQAMSLSRKLWYKTEEGEACRVRQSVVMTGRKLSEQHTLNIRLSRKGFKHTEETKKLLSTKHLGKKLSIEHRHKLSIAHLGKKLTDEHRRNISLATLGKKKVKKGVKN